MTITEQQPDETKLYKQLPLLVSLFFDDFCNAKGPNYIHKNIEHVQELIEAENRPGTIGGLSGNGKEGVGVNIQTLQKNLSRMGNTYGYLGDVLWADWFYSSLNLASIAENTQPQKEMQCLQEGKNIRSCPAACY